MHEKASTGKPVEVVQLTDMHLFAGSEGRLLGVDTFASFFAVKQLADSQNPCPDFYLLTGDLSQDETTGSYQRLAEAFSNIQTDAYYIPGNHDLEEPLHSVFKTNGKPFRNESEIELGRWRFILLNSHADGQVGGVLAEHELRRLEDFLSKDSGNFTAIVLHHHPVPVNSQWIDRIGVLNSDEFHSVIGRHRHVKAVIFGHVHQAFEVESNGVRYFGSPSTCVQFKPDSKTFAVDPLPPGYRYFKFFADGTISSKIIRLDNISANLEIGSSGY